MQFTAKFFFEIQQISVRYEMFYYYFVSVALAHWGETLMHKTKPLYSWGRVAEKISLDLRTCRWWDKDQILESTKTRCRKRSKALVSLSTIWGVFFYVQWWSRMMNYLQKKLMSLRRTSMGYLVFLFSDVKMMENRCNRCPRLIELLSLSVTS